MNEELLPVQDFLNGKTDFCNSKEKKKVHKNIMYVVRITLVWYKSSENDVQIHSVARSQRFLIQAFMKSAFHVYRTFYKIKF